jgi:hypothetical protein
LLAARHAQSRLANLAYLGPEQAFYMPPSLRFRRIRFVGIPEYLLSELPESAAAEL